MDRTLDHALVRRHSAVDEFVSDGECLLYSAVRDQASVLNRTSTEIWQLCDGARTIGDITRTLAGRYGVDEGLLLGDVAAAVSMLCERGLVEVTGAAPLT
jgi:hypothetical protein